MGFMKTAFATMHLLLLAGILIAQVMILHAMPQPIPTIGEVAQLRKPEERRAALLRQPMVRVSGSVDADVTSMP